MRIWKRIIQFYIGGSAYMTLEFLWRGRSSGSMFLLGGICFGVLGKWSKARLPMWGRAVCGAATVTMLELLAGYVVNREYAVWDYRQMPLNFQGQVCLPYSLLWLPLSCLGMALYTRTDQWIDGYGNGKRSGHKSAP